MNGSWALKRYSFGPIYPYIVPTYPYISPYKPLKGPWPQNPQLEKPALLSTNSEPSMKIQSFAAGLGFKGLGFRGLGLRGLGLRGLGFKGFGV